MLKIVIRHGTAEKVVNIELVKQPGIPVIPVPGLSDGNDEPIDGIPSAAVDADQAPAGILHDHAAIQPPPCYNDTP